MPGSPQTAPEESRRGQILAAARNILHAATREAASTMTPPPSSGDRRFDWAMIAVCPTFRTVARMFMNTTPCRVARGVGADAGACA